MTKFDKYKKIGGQGCRPTANNINLIAGNDISLAGISLKAKGTN